MLGILIGVGSIVLMMSITKGFDNYIKGELSNLGSNIFYIQKYPSGIVIGGNFRRRKDLTLDDAYAIEKYCPNVKFVAATAFDFGKRIFFKDKKTNPDVRIYAITENYFPLMNYNIDKGRALTYYDIIYKKNYCLIGKSLEEKLFGNINPINKKVKISNQLFKIIGTIKKRGSFLGQDLDNVIFIPITSLYKITHKIKNDINIAVSVSDLSKYEETIKEVEKIMRKRRKLQPGEKNDFEIVTQEDIKKSSNNIINAIFIATVGIASLSLLVGGIGIMNIMLVVVRERRKEIGIRKAIGATNSDIVKQFLTESIFICMIGGMLGFIIGIIIAYLIKILLNFPIGISYISGISALLFSSIIGIFFGLYPAIKASKINPIEAIHDLSI